MSADIASAPIAPGSGGVSSNSPEPLSRRVRARRLRRRFRPGTFVVLLAASLLVLFPFLWMISMAFTPAESAFGDATLIPAEPTFDNFVRAIEEANLLPALANSLIVGGVAVVTNCIFAVAAGYGFAMLPFRGSTALFYTLIATTAIPISVTLIPLFLMARGFPLAGGNDILGHGGIGLLDSLGGIVLPFIVLPLNIFLARQYFSSSSLDLAEAARIDGAGELRVFWKIYLPLARPLVAVIAIFSFTAVWDDFLWPLVTVTSPEHQTVQLALTRFLSSGNIQYGPMMAGAVLATLPVLLVFLFNQRHFISGLSEGSVKG
ncbi:carbohydrate ABC transporter permease [Microbacterium sp. MYb45]|uniref:carbohydrate ABC transporter permease n=1 Tax=Microbacterium sp. MYb45 TaxID=1827294 RepID=UPI000CFF5505|nr:carbohydrate ABC transporter permease [Microbacterium sp. MYb45]PRB65668.1 ABC transporter permease [Microbacterium sp. MYb45]